MMKIYDRKLAYPYFVWMTLFTVVPLIIVVYYALTDSDGNFTLNNLLSISGYGSVFARSLLLALIATVICLIIAFPVGYFLSRLRVNKQHIMLMLVMLPMWMNFLLRTYAWMGLLSVNGPVNAVLGAFGLGPYTMLNTSGAVVLGMVYNYVPYMILPLYTSMTKIDQSIVEAAQDLGASTTQTLLRVLIPMSVPGISTGITMVFVPAHGDASGMKQLAAATVRTADGERTLTYYEGTDGYYLTVSGDASLYTVDAATVQTVCTAKDRYKAAS